MGSIVYNESGLIGGSGTATITALNLGIDYDPHDPT